MQHLYGTTGFFDLQAGKPLGEMGYLGVRVFFVISGYLITSLLLTEHARTGTISLRGFYVRRAYRIFPAFYTYLAVMVIVSAFGLVELVARDVVLGVTDTMNYHWHRGWTLGHTWSLSIEEQFYLLWPAVLLFAGPRRVGWVALAMIVLAPILRVVAWKTMGDVRDDVMSEAFPCVMDSIAAGSALAAFAPRLDRSPGYQRLLLSPWLWLVVPVIVWAYAPIHRVAFEFTIGMTLQNLGIVRVVDRCARIPGAVQRALDWRPLAWVGTLSYSLYLWQQPFLNHEDPGLPWSLGLIGAFACAVASYYLVERTSFRLRDRRARR